MSNFYAGVIILLGWTDINNDHHEAEMEYLFYDEETELLYCRQDGEEVCFDGAKITKIFTIE